MVSWAEIEAACGGYREGFVSVFRRYEGQPTDEKDAKNRTVKVTAASFSRHAGIPERTFRDWLKTAAAAPARERGDREERGARTILRDAPLEQVERIISDLPPERQQAIGAAAGNAYMKARQQYEDTERNMTPAERKEREAVVSEVGRSARQLGAGFTALGIVGHIEQATEEMEELNADHALTPALIEQIEEALKPLHVELEVAKGLAGIEGGVA